MPRSPVTLRLLGPQDESDFVAGALRSRKLHQPYVSPPATPEGFRAKLGRMRGPFNMGYTVRRQPGGELVGFIEVTNIVHGLFRSAYLGYYAFDGWQRQGLLTAGLKAAVRLAFGKLKLNRLEANIQPGNAPSIALARACGFSREGYSPRYLKIRGRWRDHERWAIVARPRR